MTEYRVRVVCAIRIQTNTPATPLIGTRPRRPARNAKTLGVPFTEEPGEAAFYGPKIDFVVKDVIGREWQLGTVQVLQPARPLDLTYIGADNQSHRPVMIHRAPFGSLERFCGVLIEHFNGTSPSGWPPNR